MTKCSYCAKDELLPFHCPFCHRDFCSEHRLPENHECSQSPARIPLGPWYAKKSRINIEKVETKGRHIPSEGPLHFEKVNGKLPKKKFEFNLSRLSIGCLLLLAGLGIIFWEVYNPFFWTIIFIYFIPIPLIAIGGFLVLLSLFLIASCWSRK